ncbi:MAG: CPBP family intramembrane glutamic endopeptidase [Candidatus Promineifilaceae bacterium]|nr:CPBP family intramembrane glutamic endopeptidase [Candidatus Promineifilaceae bacterium]
MQDEKALPAPIHRVLLSFALPVAGAIVTAVLLVEGVPVTPAGKAVVLGALGIVGWLMGVRWYGLGGTGIRGGRPLYASIGFAALGWVVFFAARLYWVGSNEDVVVSRNFGQMALYLTLFEAFSVQVWAFGLFFRSVADWRGPLAAALSSGLLFGLVASQLFEEAFITGPSSLLYFMAWGVFYGLIRLRTGSILGAVIVQAMQSLTAWHILLPEPEPAIAELQNLYLAAVTFYAIFIWRLWPTEEGDYRV